MIAYGVRVTRRMRWKRTWFCFKMSMISVRRYEIA